MRGFEAGACLELTGDGFADAAANKVR